MTNTEKTLIKFRDSGRREDWLTCIDYLYEEDKRKAYKYLQEFRKTVQRIPISLEDDMELLKKSYDIAGKDYFDDFMIAMEWDRPAKNKFYLPRRKQLQPIVKALQDLADDKYDIVAISCPPGVGKSGVALFFTVFLAGRSPEEGILISSHKRAFLEGAYSECLREIRSSDYRFKDIFPERKLVKTNAADLKIAIDKDQRFPSLQFGSIEQDLAGMVRAVQLLYCDDLIGGIEEAMSKERLDNKWRGYTDDLKQRKQGDHCKELHIATRWSVNDIIGRLERQNEGDPRKLFLKIPALNEKGESNFNYGGAAGFTKEFYEEIKSYMDEASFMALYMNEPIEREGLLYSKGALRRYYQLPEGEPDAVLAVTDTAEGGGDDTVMPVFAVYGDDHYLVDIVCSDAPPTTTDNLLAQTLVRNKVNHCEFESNSAGGRTADKVRELVLSLGGFTNITKRRTTEHKETKIIVESTWVLEHVLFPDEKIIERGSSMERAINKLCAYTMGGRNKHDDVPDAFAMYAKFFRRSVMQEVRLVDRRKFGI